MGNYSTYKGRLELLKDRPNEIREGYRPSVKSPTEFGEQLVCVAQYWLSKDVIETSNNAGKYIDLFKENYFGKDVASQKQAAYCAIFMWFIIDEAAKNMGCTHKFPGAADVWANARNTLLKSKNVYRTEIDRLDTPPTVGSIMFRHSTESTSSGHMGIVIDVDTKNRTFDTIEGNVTVDNDKNEGVAAWRYRFDDVKTGNGIAFIHVEEESSCKNIKAKNYKGFECRPVIQQKQDNQPIAEVLPKCIRKVDNNYIYYNQSNQAIGTASKFNGKWYTNVAGKGWVEVTNCDYEYESRVVENKKETPAVEKNYSPEKDTSTPVVDKVKRCKDVIVAVPPKSKLQHFEALRDPKVLADITDAKIGSEAARYGSALWYNRSDINPGSNTGFGMFRDSIGNLIYVLDADQPQSQQILKNGFLGFTMDDPNAEGNILFVNRRAAYYNGGGHSERFVSDLISKDWKFGNIDNVNDLTREGALVFMPPKSHLNKVANWRNVTGQNMISYLREIENKGKPLEKPIIIYITERGTPPSAITQIKRALSVVSSVSGLIGIPVPAPIMKGSEALLAVFEQPTITGITNALPHMMQMAEFFAPETVKGATKFVNDQVGSVGKYIKEAGGTISTFVTNGYYASEEILKDAEKSLGLSSLEINKIFSRYDENNPLLDLPDLTKLTAGISMKEVNKKVQNMSNMFMVDKVRRVISSGKLDQEITSTAFPLYKVPILQDLFIAGGSNASMRLFPKIEQFTSSLLKSDQIRGLAAGNPEIIAGIIGNNFGHIPTDKGIMKDLEIEALIGRARLSNPNTPFVLPESVSEEYKECYKFIIEQESDVKVLHCPDGWDWDSNLRKCVNKTVSSGYTNTSNSNSSVTSGKVITGNTPVKTSPSNTSTKGDVYIPDDWNYFGPVKLPTEPIKKTTPLPLPIETPIKVKDPKLPPCVDYENGEYFYYPNKSKKPLNTIYEASPATTMVSVPGGNNFQLARVEIPKNSYVSLPGGIVTLPPNNGFTQGGVPSGGFGMTPLPLPIGLNDEVLPDRIRVYRTNAGQPDEVWYVRIDGQIYEFDPYGCQILGYNPNKKVEIKIPEKIVTPPGDSKEVEKLVKKLVDQQKEYETKLALERANNKTEKPDERVILLEKQLENIKLENQQKQNVLLEQLKKVSNVKIEPSPELLAQLEIQQSQIESLTKLVNQQSTPSNEPDERLLNEIRLLKEEISYEKQKTNNIQTELPKVEKAVAECTDCDLAKTVSREVRITEYGNHKKSCDQCNNDCIDCDCGECN